MFCTAPEMIPIPGSVSFWGRFRDHFRIGDDFGVGIISEAVQVKEMIFLFISLLFLTLIQRAR